MGPLGKAVGNLLLRYNWNRVAVVRSRTSVCDDGLSGIYTYLQSFDTAPEIYADNVNEIKLAVKLVRTMARSKIYRLLSFLQYYTNLFYSVSEQE